MTLSIKNKEQLEKVMSMLGITNCDEELSDGVFPIVRIEIRPFHLTFTFDALARVVDYLRNCEEGGEQ